MCVIINRKILHDKKDFTSMMSKTHLTVGLAVSLAIVQPDSLSDCLNAVIAGTVGGILPDNDILDNKNTLSAFSGQFFAGGVTILALILDKYYDLGLCRSVTENGRTAALGGILFGILWLRGVFSGHRTFTHSFAALFLYTLSLGWLCPPLTLPFCGAYASHLCLDFLNKKGLPLFYPFRKSFCLHLCYADGIINKLLLYVGILTSVFLLTLAILNSL